MPLPCPDVGDSPVIQFALVEAVQAHSGSVVTVIELLAPAASRIAGGAATETWHLTGSGPVDTVDDVSHPATTIAATSDTTATNRREFARTSSVTGDTVPTAEWLVSKHHSTYTRRLGRALGLRFD